MRLKDLVGHLPQARILGDVGLDISAIEYDTRRKISQGTLFVAFSGENFDGHDFVEDAVASGAVALVIQKDRKIQRGVTKIVVEDSRRALSPISSRFYNEPWKKLRVIGVTGTNGKTTVSMLVKSIMEAGGLKTGLIGTVNYVVGNRVTGALTTTPESLDLQRMLGQMVESRQRAVSLEVSSHGLALGKTEGVGFDTAIFTNFSRDHLDFHKSFEDYFEAKVSLFESLGRYKEGRAVINMDDPMGETILDRIDVPAITYGLSKKTQVWGQNVRMDSRGIELGVCTPIGPVDLRMKLRSRFNVMNTLAAIGAGISEELDMGQIKAGLESIEGIPGRFEAVDCGQDFTVIVDYAHTPDALENVLKAARKITSGRLISLFGCGGDRDKGKRPQMARISTTICDVTYITSDNPRTEDPEVIIGDVIAGVRPNGVYKTITDRREAIEEMLRKAESGDVVVIAGKGHENYQIIGTKRMHFDDRKVIREILSKWTVDSRQ